MANRASEFLLSLLSKYGGGALDLVRKGCSAIRGLFGHLGALVRPLLKEGLALLASKLKGGAAVVRDKAQKAGNELLRLAKTFLGKPAEKEQEPIATPETGALEKADDSAKPAPTASPVPSRQAASTTAKVRAPTSANLANRQPNAASATNDLATTFGPVLSRVLIRALSRPRRSYQHSLNSPVGR